MEQNKVIFEKMAYEIDSRQIFDEDQHQTRNANPVEHDQKGRGHQRCLCTLFIKSSIYSPPI